MDVYRVGDEWPNDQPGAEGATLMLICYCGAHVDADGGTCESCGRYFDGWGRRLINEEDLDADGRLVPIPTDV